ncbi:MAG: hypothetical protein ACPG49_12450 [Chitinophagales bacterium]
MTQALFEYILKGANYEEALQKTKLDLIKEDFAESRDWSGFVLIGR